MPKKDNRQVITINREEWLTRMAKLIEPIFKGFAIKPYKVTCGWPSRNATGRTSRAVGECHAIETSKAGVHEVFISPTLDNPLDVAGTLTHEMCHIAAGMQAKHGKDFVSVAKHVGLTKGKPRSVGPGELLEQELARMIETIGEYPHKAIVPILIEKKPRTSVTLICSQCECRITIGIKWLDLSGSPTCGCGGPMAPKDGDESE